MTELLVHGHVKVPFWNEDDSFGGYSDGVVVEDYPDTKSCLVSLSHSFAAVYTYSELEEYEMAASDQA